MQILFENYTKQMVQYMYDHPQHLHKMVQHIQTQGVSDLLQRLLNFSPLLFDSPSSLTAAQAVRSSILQALLKQLTPNNSDLQLHCATQLLNELTDVK